ncbi:MAG TPA: amidohydrolase family protein [Labilithrix sp.]|jgi:cytosine/adenosine deaminase-related metal-dependent hydrolase
MRRALAVVLLVWGASCHDQASDTNLVTPPPPGGGDDAGAVGDDGGTVGGGDPKKGILLSGTVLGPNGPFEGEVLVVGDTIVCADAGTTCEQDPKAAGVARVTADVIAPGMLDTHNHILFDIFDDDDWFPSQIYTNHDQWTAEARYSLMVDVKQCLEDASQGKPTWCPTKYDSTGNVKCELEKWGELKGLVAGTTSIVGLAGTSSSCFGAVTRAIDTQFNGLASDKIQTSALFPPSKSTADGVCKNYGTGATTRFLIHCGEGTDAKSLGEFATLGTVTTTPSCLYAPQTVITHGTAFTAMEFAVMKAHDMKLVWSPASNIALYGETANIPAALDAGVLVALAPDWSMGGSANLLVEMRAAKAWSDSKWAKRLTTKDLVTMTTANAAKVLGVDDRLGTIAKGYLADLFVVKGDKTAPYDAVVAATPKEVRLVMVAGTPRYGDVDLKALALNDAEDFDACGAAKFVAIATPNGANKTNETYAALKTILDGAIADMDQARPPGGASFAPNAAVVSCK